MKYDELAFFNQQLAGMLRSGIPLEGALRKLCETTERGHLQREFLALEKDLAAGTPLREAIARRELPEFYRNLVQIGAQSHDLPGLLTLLADYYAQSAALLMRLQGLMVYPLIVLVVALGMTVVCGRLGETFVGGFLEMDEFGWMVERRFNHVALWIPVALTGSCLLLAVGGLVVPAWRRWLRWRLPGFKDASITQCAATLSLLLRSGSTLPTCIGLVRQMEVGTPAETELRAWEKQLAAGRGKLEELATGGAVFPPLAIALLIDSEADLAAGFARVAAIYRARALARVEMLLHAALPAALVLLALMIIGQMVLVVRFAIGMFIMSSP